MRSLLLAAALTLAACSRPEPPTITPEQAKITSITPEGLGVQVRVQAYNPNASELSARSIKAKVTLDGKYDVGTVKVPATVKLPAQKRTVIDVPLSVKWTDLSALVALAAQSRGVPYEVDGTAEIGGDALSFDVPFKMGGTISHDELVKATVKSLPKLPIPIP